MTTLNQDAKNRALRSFVQGLAIDVAVVVCGLILANADKITDKAALVTFGITLGKTVLTTAAAYVMRRFLDKSTVIPTPLPPAPVPAPNDDAPVVDPANVVIVRDQPLPPQD